MGTPVRCCTRRALLISGAAVCGVHGQTAKGIVDKDLEFLVRQGIWRRFPDPTTEFEVVALTSPEYNSRMTAHYTRSIGRHNGFLLFSSDRPGTLQAFRMDLKTGQWRQLTNAKELDPESLALMPDDRGFCFFDGPSLRHMSIATRSGTAKYTAFRRAGNARRDQASRATACARRWPNSNGTKCRLRLVSIARGTATTLAEADWEMSHPILHPRRAQILYRQGDEALWQVNTDGQQNRKLKLAEGHIGPARWSPDSRTVLYLHLPDDPKQLHAIREHTPDQNLDKLVGKTSQFAHFGCNANTSVFVGASQNKASPTILLLLRVTRRELTMCEHAASDARIVAPIFSPNSQRIYFQSDHDGKRVIYMVRVDKFVEETEA